MGDLEGEKGSEENGIGEGRGMHVSISRISENNEQLDEPSLDGLQREKMRCYFSRGVGKSECIPGYVSSMLQKV